MISFNTSILFVALGTGPAWVRMQEAETPAVEQVWVRMVNVGTLGVTMTANA